MDHAVTGDALAAPGVTGRELEALYLQRDALTLGKTRKALEKMAALVAASPGHPPSLSAVRLALEELDLAGLPFHTVTMLLEAVQPEPGGQTGAALTLKDLEQVLKRKHSRPSRGR